MRSPAERLAELSRRCVSPYHMVQNAMEQLREAGYEELALGEEWSLTPGGRYMVDIYGTTCVAFRVNEAFAPGQQLRMAAAHTDWPCLRIKYNAEYDSGVYRRLNTEVYGGPIYHTWFDRPLSVAGKVTLRGADPFHPDSRILDVERPVAYLPNLAIHMNREVNHGTAINPQTELLPILGLAEGSDKGWFHELLAQELSVSPEDILGFDLYMYVQEEAVFVGMHRELLSAPRIDNLTSCQSCLQGILTGERREGIDLIALFDNEECGSSSKQGADSGILGMIMEKIADGLSLTRQQYLNLVLGGICLSVDVAHAKHPNHPEKADPTTDAAMTPSVVVKLEPNQRYATDSNAAAVVDSLCQTHNIPVTHFSNRSDVRGGSTLGSILSARLPMHTVDIGVPILAMHSARELMAAESQDCMDRLLGAFFS